jgi:PKD repeat protein
MKKGKIFAVGLLIVISTMIFSSFVITVAADVPTGGSYKLVDHHGGKWCDVEKTVANEGDDSLCWAAACANILEWTGWGLTGGLNTTDDMFAHYVDYWNDHGGNPVRALPWWFDGTDPGGGALNDTSFTGFWNTAPDVYDVNDYYDVNWDAAGVLFSTDEWLRAGNGVSFGICREDKSRGHHITCWGFNYDPAVYDPLDPEETDYLGIWVTDSDDYKVVTPAPDVLKYYEVDWNGTMWLIPNYIRELWPDPITYCLVEVHSLAPFPSSRPVADAGGPYASNEGSAITLDASGSFDADAGDTLWYRWDLDNDGDWDTPWSASPTYSETWDDSYNGMVGVLVYDEHMYDVDTATVTVSNVAPTITAVGDTIDENGFATVSGTISDPGADDTFSVAINWGDESSDTYAYPTDSTGYSESHQYLDDNPSGTPSDIYSVTVTVTDDDGGVDIESTTVTVNNVDPDVNAGAEININEGETANFAASFSDPGTNDTHGITWDSEDLDGSLTPSYVYGDNIIFDVTLTVTDDDTGTDSDTLTVTVNNVDPSIESLDSYSVDENTPVTIIATATDPGSDDLTFTWDWDDGTSDTVTIYYNDGTDPDPIPSPDVNPMDVTDTAIHTYADPGTYTVTLTVVDDDGGVDTDTYSVQVLTPGEAVDMINDLINDLPDGAFKGKADNRKDAFEYMFSAIGEQLAEEKYQGAIMDLLLNVRTKVDGEVDGLSKNDWITNTVAQQDICWKIDGLVAYLETLI